nr:transposase [Hoeflea sp.]
MRFVAPKTAEQQSRAAVFRDRERLVHQRTADVNAMRALLYEHGHVFPIGMRHLNRMMALVDDETVDLPALIREECQDLLGQIAEKTERITESTTKLKALAAQSDKARRLQTMPGVGPLTAVAVDAFGPDMVQFKIGRDFAAWLGLVPKQHSSGGKERLGRMTKAGPGRYPTPPDHRRDVTTELAWTTHNCAGQLAVADVGAQAQDPGRDRAGQQDGPADLGDVDEERGLQGSGISRIRRGQLRHDAHVEPLATVPRGEKTTLTGKRFDDAHSEPQAHWSRARPEDLPPAVQRPVVQRKCLQFWLRLDDSITCPNGQKLLALRAATTEAGCSSAAA